MTMHSSSVLCEMTNTAPSSSVLQWEIRRYRFDKSAREWLLKGSTLIKDSDEHGIIDRRCYVVPHLQVAHPSPPVYRYTAIEGTN